MPEEAPQDLLARVLVPQLPERVAQVFAGQLGRVASLFQMDDSPASCERLARVLIDYIKAAPGAVDHLDAIARTYHLSSAIDDYTALAKEDINKTYQALKPAVHRASSVETLLALLQNAYFVLRLLEELNDCAENFMGIPLTAISPMTANIIVHGVIGDRFANRLDGIVSNTIKPSALTKAIVEAPLDRARVESLRRAHCALSGEPARDFVETYGLKMY